MKTGFSQWLLRSQTTEQCALHVHVASGLHFNHWAALQPLLLCATLMQSMSHLSFRRLYPKKARKTNAITAPVVISSRMTESYFNCARYAAVSTASQERSTDKSVRIECKWKTGGNGKTHWGVVAQDMEAVVSSETGKVGEQQAPRRQFLAHAISTHAEVSLDKHQRGAYACKQLCQMPVSNPAISVLAVLPCAYQRSCK